MKLKIHNKNVMEELEHKVNIVLEEPGLQENYEMSEEEVLDLYNRLTFLTAQVAECEVVLEITDKEAKLIKAEMENALDIDLDNKYYYTVRVSDETQLAICKQSIKDLKKFLKQFPKEDED